MQYGQSSGEETIRVLVADDTRIHTQLLADALRRDRYLEVISSPSHSRDLIEVAGMHHFDVLVISSNLDEEPLRGFEVLRGLRATRPDLRSIMLLDSSKREAVLQAFRSGARGIFSRHDSVETLCKCVRTVQQGQVWANSQQMSYAVEALASSPTVRAVDANGLNLLSKRELDVVRSLAEGLTNREIAERLGLSQHTIKNYLFRVFDKLGVSSRLELLFMTLAQPVVPQHAGPASLETSNNRGRRSSSALAQSGNGRARLAGSAPHTSANTTAGNSLARDLSVRMRMTTPDQPRTGRRDQQSEKRPAGVAAAIGGDPLG
jgi:two-component system nitrate/nitrite response regulator NarL